MLNTFAMIIELLKIKTQLKKRLQVLEILQSMQNQTLVKRDCIACNIYVAHDNEDEIIFLQKWHTKEALYRHIQSDLYIRVLTAMELADEPPEICFCDVTEINGIELIETLRQVK